MSREREIVSWVARLGAVSVEQIGRRFGVGRSVAYEQVRRLAEFGLLERTQTAIGDPTLIGANRDGIKYAGLGLRTPTIRIGEVDHWLACADVAIELERRHVLDQLTKTPIMEIHLFDDDVLLTHNAFRSPGAPSLEQLRDQPMKVDHYEGMYSHMRDGIVPYAYRIDESTIDELREMDFVFICIDDGPSRKIIVDHLNEWDKPFIDVGMGALERDGSIGGQLRVTTSTPAKRDHVDARLTYGNAPEDDYRNIQVADMNALNALLAVIRWKKIVGFYDDLEHEHNAIYLIDGNILINEDQA